MGTTELILVNEASNTGSTIYAYKKNEYWSIYGISAFLLCSLIKAVKVGIVVFPEYQVKMPVVSISEDRLRGLMKRLKVRANMSNFKMMSCIMDIVYSKEAYIIWAKNLSD